MAVALGRPPWPDPAASHDGRAIYLWSRITPQSARWEQAFSLDEGHSWKTNWTMDFTRM